MSVEQLSEISRAGVGYFSSKIQPRQMAIIKITASAAFLVASFFLGFWLISQLPARPINALNFVPIVLIFLFAIFGASGVSSFLEIKLYGGATWLGQLAIAMHRYHPRDIHAYKQIISSILSRSLTEDQLDEWIASEYRSLCGEEALVPDEFHKKDWSVMMKLGSRYELL